MIAMQLLTERAGESKVRESSGRPSETGPGSAQISRATLLRRVGLGVGTFVVAGAGALGYRKYDQGVLEIGKGPAYAPWSDSLSGQGMLPLVGAAILAPSPHNAQAWLFRVDGKGIDLFADDARGTGAIDPFRREMYVGLGAALENLVLAAKGNGYAARVSLMPNRPEATHAARVELSPAPRRVSPLSAQIPNRHTNRYPYADKDVPRAALAAMTALAGADSGSARVFWFTSPRARQRTVRNSSQTESIVADPDPERERLRVVPAGLG